MSSPKIPLFDVDWTLLKGGSSNNIHHDAFSFALRSIYQKSNASVHEINREGKIDTQILIEVLALHGVSEDEAKAKMPQALGTMRQYFKAHADEGTFEPMPGVVDLLSALKSQNVPMGLLTGNVKEIALEKLERAGIRDYFSFGGFGSMAFKRVDLIEIAGKEASKVLGRDIPVHDFVIVGDSPLDIACARAGGVPVIAVGSGLFKSHELTHADLTIDSLEEKAKILKFLSSDPGSV